MSRKNPIKCNCCGFQEEKYEDKERLEDWRRKELERQSNTRPYSPIARPRRIQARMTGRCRGRRPQFAPGEEVFARARIFRPGRNYSSELHEFSPGRGYFAPGEITPMSSMNFRSRRGTMAQAKSHSSWTKNAYIGWKRERKEDLELGEARRKA